ncbi:hypothetical protein ASF94_04455 [Acidovorax sp. Leaf160]|nr:hypothetical protein ASF94_04455 [Acidovorax sp. Leaf160]
MEDCQPKLREAWNTRSGAPTRGLTIDFKQATELLELFGDEMGEISLMKGDGHSGPGLYGVWTADPDGAFYLGQTDEEAVPDATPQAAPPGAAMPNSWKLVPVKPTRAMLNAGSDDLRLGDVIGTLTRAGECWRAMVAAAPAASGGQVPADEATTADFEHRRAMREAHEIGASDAYFAARPAIDCNDRRKVFTSGFERGWDAAVLADPRHTGGAA